MDYLGIAPTAARSRKRWFSRPDTVPQTEKLVPWKESSYLCRPMTRADRSRNVSKGSLKDSSASVYLKRCTVSDPLRCKTYFPVIGDVTTGKPSLSNGTGDFEAIRYAKGRLKSNSAWHR